MSMYEVGNKAEKAIKDRPLKHYHYEEKKNRVINEYVKQNKKNQSHRLYLIKWTIEFTEIGVQG